MTHEHDPVRLVDGGGDAHELLRRLVRQSRADVPGPAELAQLESALGPALGPPTGGPTAQASGSGLIRGKLAGAGAGAIAVGGLIIAALHFAQPAPPASPAVGGPHQTAAPTENAAGAERPPPATPDAIPAPEPRPTATASPTAPPRRLVAPRPAQRPRPSEAELLEQARAVLRNDPRRSLALAREHQRRFPRGALAQEREVIAIEALARLDREEEARRRAKGFDERYPESPHKPKVDSAARDE